jgi:hypothetical protein
VKPDDAIQHCKFSTKHRFFFKESRRMMPQRYVAQKQLIQATDLGFRSITQYDRGKQLAHFARKFGLFNRLRHLSALI